LCLLSLHPRRVSPGSGGAQSKVTAYSGNNKESHASAATKRRRREPIEDTSNITTPTNTAPALLTAGTRSRPSIGLDDKGRAAGPSTAAQKKGLSKKKEKAKLVTPLEYAQTIQNMLAEDGAKRKLHSDQFLKGKRIFYFGGDLKYAGTDTRGKMDYLTKHGATLLPVYDPDQVTHIITNAAIGTFKRGLGIKSLDEIPAHIPVLKWTWVVSGCGGRRMARYHDHASYPERITFDLEDDDNVTQPRAKGKGKQRADAPSTPPIRDASEEVSGISEFTQEREVRPKSKRSRQVEQSFLPSPSQSPDHRPGSDSERMSKKARVSPSRGKNMFEATPSLKGHNAEPYPLGKPRPHPQRTEDPLSAFYEQARAERDAELSGTDSDPDGEKSTRETNARGTSTAAGKSGVRTSVNHGARYPTNLCLAVFSKFDHRLRRCFNAIVKVSKRPVAAALTKMSSTQ